jgi:hypothetical protein
MQFTFLEDNTEAYILFATAPVYVAILVWLQSKNLKIIEKLKNKRTNEKEKLAQFRLLKRLKRQTPFLILIGLSVHLIIYVSYIDTPVRLLYFHRHHVCRLYFNRLPQFLHERSRRFKGYW